jgi:hypothetical protein
LTRRARAAIGPAMTTITTQIHLRRRARATAARACDYA